MHLIPLANSITMQKSFFPLPLFLFAVVAFAAEPKLPGVGAAMDEWIAKNEIAGAVTVVATKDETLHLESNGYADIASKRAMTPDTLMYIASMTKPITGVAILMLQDEGKLSVTDPVAKFIPEFADLKTPSGKPANLTITQVLNHTSGLGEAGGPKKVESKTLAELVPAYVACKMQFEPGEQWKYTQSGINVAARIVEVVSGMSFEAFLKKRIFDPLAMKDTTFYPSDDQRLRMATAYAKNMETGALEVISFLKSQAVADFGTGVRPPRGSAGLFSTANDYARFCQMLLNQGTLGDRRILSEKAAAVLVAPNTGSLPTGHFKDHNDGQLGMNYSWGIGMCILKAPHDGVAAMLSPGSYGHGGGLGTQAWIDPVKGVVYLLMVQRSNFPNSDASDVRRTFQQAAADALAKRRG